jgi:hypothetical protein
MFDGFDDAGVGFSGDAERENFLHVEQR